ncbi:MAG: transketolase C-terminal domain-containing protein [bacterium]|nr:transketolase C-terminal domain-containing protein [bacterium]
MAPTRDGYGIGLVEVAEKNVNVVALSADLTESTRAAKFRDLYPDRFIQMGVAEQNMVTVAVGLALQGKIPFVSTYAVFSPGRTWDQIRISVCYNNANVKLAGHHAGLSVGPDGATHQALEDLALTRVLPRLTVLAPCDAEEARKATHAAAAIKGPVYLRFSREKSPVFTTAQTPFTVGKARVLHDGKDAVIIACGPLVYEALVAADRLVEKGISVRVINMASIKPMDEETVERAARECRAVVTAEEHQVAGGLGGAVAETLARSYPVPVEMVGMRDSFGESGQPEELWRKYRLNAAAMVDAVIKVIKRKH